MATITTFEDIEAWKLARELCKEIGTMIDSGLFKNNYRLIGQIEGSSGSIMDNIAEGFERGSRKEFIVFLGYAKGSSGELRSQLCKAFDRKYITQEMFDMLQQKTISISSMLQKFISYLLSSDIQGVRHKNVKP
jgi:four helix bundle protein